LLIYSVSYFNLEGMTSPMLPWRLDWFKFRLCCHYWNTYKEM